ncbi:hypothetical protein E2C01_064185 [Portunus trituberculatus]|uniref:Uncharacterized protein n=1 Tax=Portunus trituberculatus TaxID=210409 RepID=A0A5B7HFL3_PORTR|nr:hypothetical protein [Portunus trituberculatus]
MSLFATTASSSSSPSSSSSSSSSPSSPQLSTRTPLNLLTTSSLPSLHYWEWKDKEEGEEKEI